MPNPLHKSMSCQLELVGSNRDELLDFSSELREVIVDLVAASWVLMGEVVGGFPLVNIVLDLDVVVAVV